MTRGVAAALLLAGAVLAPAHAVAQPVADDVVGQAVVEGASVVTMVPVRVLSDPEVSRVECISVAGAHGIPAEATGVVVNVTTVQPERVGNVVVFPDTSGNGTPTVPHTSTVNYEPGRDVASSTFVDLGENGDLCYASRSLGRVGLLMDVSGYVEEGSGLNLAPPSRLLDTRIPAGGGALAPRIARTLQVAGEAGVPDDAESVILNVTVAGVSAPGNLRVYPGGEVPGTSVVNYAPGVDKANTTVVAMAEDGTVSLFSDSDRDVHVVIDVLGWTEAGGSHVGVEPTRVLDTREDPEGPNLPPAPLDAGFVYSLVFDAESIPAEATALVLNVTAIQPSTTGNLRVYPGDPDQGLPPDASSINYIPGRDIPNLVVVGLPEEGFIDVFSDQPDGATVDLAVDVVGYISD